jgi:hypothetical protein
MDVDLERQANAFIDRFLAAGEPERAALRSMGAALADRLRRRAIGMAYSRATEFSPKLKLYHLLAAKVAWLVYGHDTQASATLAMFERNIRYYRNFPSTQALVDEYERFRVATQNLTSLHSDMGH